jgi:hypothetical protein
MLPLDLTLLLFLLVVVEVDQPIIIGLMELL